jgi:hypothetical protein
MIYLLALLVLVLAREVALPLLRGGLLGAVRPLSDSKAPGEEARPYEV